jgi:AMP nucleosidase
LVPEGIKTDAMDKKVNEQFVNLHLHMGVEAMTEIGEKGEQIKHFSY